MIQSMPRVKIKGVTSLLHPCIDFEGIIQFIVAYYLCRKVSIQHFHNVDHPFWYSIVAKYSPQRLPMDTVERFFQVHKLEVQRHVPFLALLQDVPQCEEVVQTGSVSPKSCLFSDAAVQHNCQSAVDDLAEDLAGDGQRCNTSPVVTV